jgi:hypothetical protein
MILAVQAGTTKIIACCRNAVLERPLAACIGASRARGRIHLLHSEVSCNGRALLRTDEIQRWFHLIATMPDRLDFDKASDNLYHISISLIEPDNA